MASTRKSWTPCFGRTAKACPDRDPGVNFMPGVWQRIEARQRNTFSFLPHGASLRNRRGGCHVGLGSLHVRCRTMPARGGAYQQNYLEALADANSLDTPDIVGPVHLELTEDASSRAGKLIHAEIQVFRLRLSVPGVRGRYRRGRRGISALHGADGPQREPGRPPEIRPARSRRSAEAAWWPR